MSSRFMIVFVITTTLIQTFLALRQIRHLQTKAQNIPLLFKEPINKSDTQKAIAYNITKLRFSIFKNCLVNGFILLIITSNFLNFILLTWQSVGTFTVLGNTGFFLTLVIIQQLLTLFFSYWQIFKIEQRFGFNTMTLNVFLFDFSKQIILILMVSLPLLIVANWLLTNSMIWWFWIWLIGMGVGLLNIMLYPVIKSRYFYQHTSLTDAGLIKKIQLLLLNYGFSLNQVFVINSSSRTQHSNAHFVGFGRFKRILLADTLMNDFSSDEITAIIAHELGHYYRQHIFKYFLINSALSLMGLSLLNWIINQTWHSSTVISIAMIFLLFPLIYFWLKPLLSFITRYFERDADDFAVLNGQKKPLHQALIKLYSDNASTLSTDPLYSLWFDTHPAPQLRLNRLSGQ